MGNKPWYTTLAEGEAACNSIPGCKMLHDDHCDGKNYRLCTRAGNSIGSNDGNARACFWQHPGRSPRLCRVGANGVKTWNGGPGESC